MAVRQPQKQKKRFDKRKKNRERHFLEGYNCSRCKHFRSIKRGCPLDSCVYEYEKLGVAANTKAKRKREPTQCVFM